MSHAQIKAGDIIRTLVPNPGCYEAGEYFDVYAYRVNEIGFRCHWKESEEAHMITPTNRTDFEVVDLSDNAQLYAYCGADGSRWAKAFMRVRMSSPLKWGESDMIGWFANAIETSYPIKRDREIERAKATMPPVPPRGSFSIDEVSKAIRDVAGTAPNNRDVDEGDMQAWFNASIEKLINRKLDEYQKTHPIRASRATDEISRQVIIETLVSIFRP